MLIPFGILSAAGAGKVALVSDFELIESFVLGTASSSITFSSLGTYSSTYKHLQLRVLGRTTDDSGFIRIRLNGDTGSNYNLHGLKGNGSSVSSFNFLSLTGAPLDDFASSTSTANTFSAHVVDLLDVYSTTKTKTIRSLQGKTSANSVTLSSNLYNSTSSITSINLFNILGNFAVGSRFSLYGIKG